MQIGTVKDNQKAPIHRWFNHPAAGFSYRLVKSLVSYCEAEGRCLVLDPFVGCGTTAVEAKKNGVDCIGLEAHPLAWWIAKVKCFWEYDLNSLEATMLLLQDTITRGHEWRRAEIDDYPDQVRKCFSDENLQKLTYIRQLIHNIVEDERERDFFLLSLIGILRRASRISLGWSYIALDERHRKREKEAITLFLQQTNMMFADLVSVFKGPFARSGHADILLADAREFPPVIIPESVCLVITSPPYLNNFDYAEHMMLEMLFLGLARTRKEVAAHAKGLIVSSTYQLPHLGRKNYQIGDDVWSVVPGHRKEIESKINRLREIRDTKRSGKKYDLVVAGYIDDMYRVLRQIYRALRPGGKLVMVLGDSAPYGVHIPTETYLKEVGIGIGFRLGETHCLRERGKKWKSNSRKHQVPLKEVLLILTK